MMDQYIADLLNSNNRIIIPGFGALIKREGTSSGSYIITFSPFLKYNDGLLVSHIAKKENCTKELAQTKLDNFVTNLKSELNTKKKYDIVNLGTFTIDDKGNMNFEMKDEISIPKSSTDTPPIIPKTEESKTTSKKEESRNNNPEDKKPKPNVPITNNVNNNFWGKFMDSIHYKEKRNLYVGIIASLLFIFLLLIILDQTNVVNIFGSSKEKNKTTVNKEVKKVITKDEYKVITDNKKTAKKKIPQDINPKTGEYMRYYIMAGSFRIKGNADKFSKKMKNLGYEGKIILKENNIYSVSQASYWGYTEAKANLLVYRKRQTDLWLYRY